MLDMSPTLSVTAQTAIGVSSAILLAIIVLSCVFCLRIIRQKLLRHKNKYDEVPEMVEIPDPFRPKTEKEEAEIVRVTSLHGLDLVSRNPQRQLSYSSDMPDSAELYSDCRGFEHVKSLDDLRRVSDDEADDEDEDVAMAASRRWQNRSRSVSTLPVSHDQFDTSVRFSLQYIPAEATLILIVHEVTFLPFKQRGKMVYGITYLYPFECHGRRTRAVLGESSTEIREVFKFQPLSKGDLDKATLKICIYCNKAKKSAKHHMIGQAYMKGGDFGRELTDPKNFSLKLVKKQVKRQSTSEKYMFRDMGELLLLLQFQHQANRIKVLVRKARNLPRSDKLLGYPEHYIIIKLLKYDEEVSSQETSAQSGYSPVWNQPFLFDIPDTDISAFSLEFVVMRGKRYNKDGVVGHVTIGSETSSTGINHWVETTKPDGREVEKWHNLMPVFKFQLY